jgi:hypothetical protein
MRSAGGNGGASTTGNDLFFFFFLVIVMFCKSMDKNSKPAKPVAKTGISIGFVPLGEHSRNTR